MAEEDDRPRRLTRTEMARLACSIVDATSRDPTYAQQLPPEQWHQLGRFLGEHVVICEKADEFAQEVLRDLQAKSAEAPSRTSPQSWKN